MMRQSTEHTFTSWDGTNLFYRNWQGNSNKAVLLFHRGHEHSARWQDVVTQLNLPEFHIFAWDARGHGHSPGERGYAETFNHLIKDVDSFVHFISDTYHIPHENMIILAHSVGSVLVSTWVHDYAPNIRALILGSPALRVRLYVPFAIPVLRLFLKFKKKIFINSYVKGKLLTHDPQKIDYYNNDPLITRAIAVNILVGLYDAGTRLMQDAGAITVPTLLLTSGADWVVKQSAQKKFFAGLSSRKKEMHLFPDFFHDTFNEKENFYPINAARRYIIEAFSSPREQPNLQHADKEGYTKAEYDTLSSPLPTLSPKRLAFGLFRYALRTLGIMSQAIQLGWKYGFDSGTMLDYVYRNKANGTGIIGKIMDRIYLDSIGWRGIRQRKIHIETMLRQTIEKVITEKDHATIVDIATGHGRYVLDVIKDYPTTKVTAILRDYNEVNVKAGNDLAAELGLHNVTYQQGDAFDRNAIQQISVNPDIIIVSGLYELFPDNTMVSTSLQALGMLAQKGTILIYTNQPWHPQLELIARVLPSHRDGKPWIMRRRTQQEMDQLVSVAGFKKLAMDIDGFGIFSVSLARKE
jgi:alpha-beta hydrolase superfamily lysophospholipase